MIFNIFFIFKFRQGPSQDDSSKAIIFNTNEVTNDLEGSLHGNVLFAQNIIIPSKAATDPFDYRPHLVSLRDTLILFKPIGSSKPESGVNVSISDKSNQQIFIGDMSPPDAMPRIAGQAPDDIDEYDFIEPENYEYVFDSQEKLDLIDDDQEGDYLKDLLTAMSFLKIETADGRWIRDFYLPSIEALDDNEVLLVFDIKSSWSCNVHYNGKEMTLQPGTKMVFTCIQGTWNTINESFHEQNKEVMDLIATRNYNQTVQGSRKEINKMLNDEKGERINELLTAGNLNIILAVGARLDKFWLPKGNERNEGKFVTFTCEASKSHIFYDYGKLTIFKGENLVFLYKNGKWIEFSDAFFAKIKYVDGYWSLKIPSEAVLPEISFTFSQNDETGVLRDVEIGAPNQLLLHTIDIGMLVSPRDEFEFQKESKYHAEYFQQVPLSRLIVNEYEPITFETVVMPDGTVYTNASAAEGGYHFGDMREHIGKALVSIGINHANYGMHSSGGPSQDTPRSCNQITAHNSRGIYKNGLKTHGLSGGGSIVTLLGSVGNEFSHELGHNYNLRDYPKGFNGSVHRSSEHMGSSWGWDSEKNVFIPNFERTITGEYTCLWGKCQKPFFGHKFGTASMAGGGGGKYPTNSYTLHTPFELERIQQHLEKKAFFDSSSTTGYKTWNSDCKCMQEQEWITKLKWKPQITPSPTQCSSLDSMKEILSQYSNIRIPLNNKRWTQDIYIPAASGLYVGKVIHVKHRASNPANLHIGSKTIRISNRQDLIFVGKEDQWEQVNNLPPGKLNADANVPRTPVLQGVPVTTLLGYYDPEGILPGYIYPSLHGAFGNTFADDSVGDDSGCVATIRNSTGQALSYALRGSRKWPRWMNKFHINVAESFMPQNISVECHGSAIAHRDITGPTKAVSYTVNGRPI